MMLSPGYCAGVCRWWQSLQVHVTINIAAISPMKFERDKQLQPKIGSNIAVTAGTAVAHTPMS